MKGRLGLGGRSNGQPGTSQHDTLAFEEAEKLAGRGFDAGAVPMCLLEHHAKCATLDALAAPIQIAHGIANGAEHDATLEQDDVG